MEELKCNLCGKTFKDSSGLGGHKAALHGIKKPPQPKLKDLLRDGLAELRHHIAGLEGRVVALERAKLQAPLPLEQSQRFSALEGRVASLERVRSPSKVTASVDPGLAALVAPIEKKKELWEK